MPYIHRYSLQDASAALNYPFPFYLTPEVESCCATKLLLSSNHLGLEATRKVCLETIQDTLHRACPVTRMVNPTIRPKCPLKNNKYML